MSWSITSPKPIIQTLTINLSGSRPTLYSWKLYLTINEDVVWCSISLKISVYQISHRKHLGIFFIKASTEYIKYLWNLRWDGGNVKNTGFFCLREFICMGYSSALRIRILRLWWINILIFFVKWQIGCKSFELIEYCFRFHFLHLNVHSFSPWGKKTHWNSKSRQIYLWAHARYRAYKSWKSVKEKELSE